MRHGGGGGGFSENPTPMIGAQSAVVPFLALGLLITMPKRWPVAFRRVLLYVLPLSALSAGVTLVTGYDSLTSGWVLFPVLFCGWHISSKYMTRAHYHPSPRRKTQAQREADHLAQYAHLRSPQAWKAHQERNGK